MKKIVLLIFGLISLFQNSSAEGIFELKKLPKDSLGYHKINFSFTWFEVGATIPLKEKKLLNLPYGMGNYLYGSKIGMNGSIFGLGIYYKNHWGISTIFLFQDYSVPDASFKNYISSQYPGYFVSSNVQGHTYTLYNINYRLSYRFQKGHIIYEPQFQLGINDCDDFDSQFVLKERGSNQFIEYEIRKHNNKKNLFSYRAAIMANWYFTKPDWKWNIEPGLRLELLVIPTNFNYIVTTSPYNMPATVKEVNVKRMRPAIGITTFLRFFRK